MKKIIFDKVHRQKHFEFFNQMANPHFNICAQVDINSLLQFTQKHSYPFTPTMVYLLSYIANSIPQFKQRIRENSIVEHKFIHPSFSVTTEVSDVFSFCEVKYTPDYQHFIKKAKERIDLMQSQPSFEDEPGRDDYVFMSSIPWIAFTGFQHAMHSPTDSVPRIVWGKYVETGSKTMLPLSIQAHHALVDGRHTGLFFQQFEQFATHPESLLNS